MSGKHTSAKREPRTTTNGRRRAAATGCSIDQRATKGKSATTGKRHTRSDSVADKKMLRAWETITANRGEAKSKR